MRIVSDERVARFVSDGIGRGIVPPYVAVGLENDAGEIVTGVIFNCFHHPDVHMTAVGSTWPRTFLSGLGEYAFSRLGCERVTLITEQEHVVKLGQRVGGKIEGVMRNRFGPGRDGVVVGILKDDYRYLPINRK